MSAQNWKVSQTKSVFRKIAMGSWWNAGDPSVYGLIEIDMTKTLDFLKSHAQFSNITPAHLVGKAISICLTERPEINGLIRCNKIYQRSHVDLFYQVNIPGKSPDPVGTAALTGCTVRQAENLSLTEIAQQLHTKASALRQEQRGELTHSISVLSKVPWSLMKWVLNISAYINYDLGISMAWAGMPKDAFGSCMITNVGSLGLEVGWAPLIPFTRVPLLLTVGAVQTRPVVVNDQVLARPTVKIGVTFDHRFMDGVHAAAMNQKFKQVFENPEKYFL
jgi:pyruvate dehydrogenase E2 component (dihydrolipoamide acetyltransferase)